MLLGNVGVATVAATIMVSFMNTSAATTQQRTGILAMLAAGLVLLWVIFNSRWIERHMNRMIAWMLKNFTDLDVRDYVSLLELSSGYAVSEMLVEPKDWLSEKSLAALRLSDEGILILGIRPENGKFLGTPRGEDKIHPGDTLIVYGHLDDIARLDQRRAGRAGDKEHKNAVEEQEEFEETHRLELSTNQGTDDS
jgi:hypothetical protein